MQNTGGACLTLMQTYLTNEISFIMCQNRLLALPTRLEINIIDSIDC